MEAEEMFTNFIIPDNEAEASMVTDPISDSDFAHIRDQLEANRKEAQKLRNSKKMQSKQV